MNHILTGKYKLQVLNENNEVVWDQPEYKKNLILNKGLDQVASTPYAQLFSHAIIGTGSRANSIYFGGATITQVGSAVILTGSGSFTDFLAPTTGYTNMLEVGDVIKYATGSSGITEVTVTDTISNTGANVYPTLTMPDENNFTIWKTSQVSLHSEYKRAGPSVPGSSYYVAAGTCGTTYEKNHVKLKRTYHFPYEIASKTYTEIGVGWNFYVNGENSTFSRILLDTPVVVTTGNLIRFVYELDIELLPSASVTASNAQISGWPKSPSTNTNITESIQQYGLVSVGTNGDPVYSQFALDPYKVYDGYYGYIWISPTGSLAPMGSSFTKEPIYAVTPMYGMTYLTGSYVRYKYGTFNPTQMNRSDIKSFGISDGLPTTNVYAVILEQTQSKQNTEELNLVFKFNWGRNIEN